MIMLGGPEKNKKYDTSGVLLTGSSGLSLFALLKTFCPFRPLSNGLLL